MDPLVFTDLPTNLGVMTQENNLSEFLTHIGSPQVSLCGVVVVTVYFIFVYIVFCVVSVVYFVYSISICYSYRVAT